MDHYYIKLPLPGVFQELPEGRAFGDGLMLGGASLFPVGPAWDPAPGLTKFMEEPFLSIQGMTLHLRRIRDSDISHRPHSPTSQPSRSWAVLREAIASATWARVLRKCSTAM